MHPDFQKQFRKLQHLLQQYEEEVKNLSFEEANKTPQHGGWSIAQIIHHISHVEAGALQYIQKKIQTPLESEKSGIKAAYRSFLLNWALRSSRRFKAPKILVEPTGPYSTDELFTHWKKTRLELGNMLETVPNEHIHRMFFTHPYVGKINLVQTLKFHASHMKRHLQQIRHIR